MTWVNSAIQSGRSRLRGNRAPRPTRRPKIVWQSKRADAFPGVELFRTPLAPYLFASAEHDWK